MHRNTITVIINHGPAIAGAIYSQGVLTMSKTITLKALKKGELFKRKLDSKTVFIREHFNRKDSFGPASICCSDAEDINREVFLNPNTTVFLDFNY